MNSPLQLEAEDIGILIEGYQRQKEKLLAEIQGLTAQVRRLDEKMNALSKVPLSTKEPPATQSDYKTSWTWNEKIEYFLSLSKHPLSARELVTKIIEHEPVLERKKVMSSVSATLTTAASAGKRYKKVGEFPETKYVRLA